MKARLRIHVPQGEVVYTVPSLWLHISENDQRILSSLHPGQKTQGKKDWRRGIAGSPVPTVLISLP